MANKTFPAEFPTKLDPADPEARILGDDGTTAGYFAPQEIADLAKTFPTDFPTQLDPADPDARILGSDGTTAGYFTPQGIADLASGAGGSIGRIMYVSKDDGDDENCEIGNINKPCASIAHGVMEIHDAFHATSVSTVTIGTGSKTFAIAETDLLFEVGERVRIERNEDDLHTQWMEGNISAFTDGASMTVSVDRIGGSGPFSAWLIHPAKPLTVGVLPSISPYDEQIVHPAMIDIQLMGATLEYTGLGFMLVPESGHHGQRRIHGHGKLMRYCGADVELDPGPHGIAIIDHKHDHLDIDIQGDVQMRCLNRQVDVEVFSQIRQISGYCMVKCHGQDAFKCNLWRHKSGEMDSRAERCTTDSAGCTTIYSEGGQSWIGNNSLVWLNAARYAAHQHGWCFRAEGYALTTIFYFASNHFIGKFHATVNLKRNGSTITNGATPPDELSGITIPGTYQIGGGEYIFTEETTQVATTTITTGADDTTNVHVAITGDSWGGSVEFDVAVESGQTAQDVAAAIAAVMSVTASLTAVFSPTVDGNVITLTKVVSGEADTNLNMILSGAGVTHSGFVAEGGTPKAVTPVDGSQELLPNREYPVWDAIDGGGGGAMLLLGEVASIYPPYPDSLQPPDEPLVFLRGTHGSLEGQGFEVKAVQMGPQNSFEAVYINGTLPNSAMRFGDVRSAAGMDAVPTMYIRSAGKIIVDSCNSYTVGNGIALKVSGSRICNSQFLGIVHLIGATPVLDTCRIIGKQSGKSITADGTPFAAKLYNTIGTGALDTGITVASGGSYTQVADGAI